MKKVIFYLMAIVIAVSFFSCNKSDDFSVAENTLKESSLLKSAISDSRLPLVGGGVYTVTLESVVSNSTGTYTWTWSVLNPNPGNGDGTTVQDLSHWNIKLGTCVTFANVLSGAMGSTDGVNYTTSFKPTWENDDSMKDCPLLKDDLVLKFDAGTSGTAKSYYQLTINIDVQIDTDVLAYYKSGTNTGCGTLRFPGFGCENACDVTASSSAGTILCYGEKTTVTVSANGGTPPYSGTGEFEVSAGDYSFTVTDDNGCQATTSGTVSEPPALSLSIVGANVFPSGSGSASVEATGGTPGYTYSWSPGGAITPSITNLGAGVYTVVVTDANGCTASDSYTVTQCLGAGGGKTLGFWSNKNGQALVTAAFITQLNALYLRTANGNHFDMPGSLAANKTALNNWLLSASATNMAYMLSAQLAATQMNVMVGFVNGDALIYAPGTNSANFLGFASVNAVMAEANDILWTTGSILTGNPLRPRAEAVKNALDKSNNNLNFLVACN